MSLISFSLLLFTSSAAAAQICGGVGSYNSSTTFFYMSNFFSKAASTFGLCADFCKSSYPSCKSFRYSYWSDADAQYCEFFGDWL